MTDPRTIDVYNAKAEEYSNKFESEKPGLRLKQFMETLPTAGHVLDLGCGPGGTTAHMAQAGFKVTGMDLSPQMLAIAKTKADATFICAGFDDLDAIEAFDGVWANFSLLHAPREDIPRHFEAIHNALKPSGVFHLGLKTGTGTARDKLDRLYTYFEEEELLELLRSAGFGSFKISKGAESGMAGTVEPFIIILSKKGE